MRCKSWSQAGGTQGQWEESRAGPARRLEDQGEVRMLPSKGRGDRLAEQEPRARAPTPAAGLSLQGRGPPAFRTRALGRGRPKGGARSLGAGRVEPRHPGDCAVGAGSRRGVPPTQPPIQKMPKGRRGSQSPTMSQRPAPPLYFPSLYDRGVSSSPLSDFNIWKKLFVPLKAGGAPAGGAAGGRALPQAAPASVPPPPPGLGPRSERPCPPPWPSGLASIPYEPLRFFYSPPPGPEVAASALAPGPTTPGLASASHPEELCELEIRIKELELLTITGDGFDSQRCA